MKKYLIIFLALAAHLAIAQKSTSSFQEISANPKILPVLWHQTSAEYRALCYQAFNIATLRINEIPVKELKKGRLAIITDLDETILDNSASEAQLILTRQSHSSVNWKEWTKLHAATAVPGAVEFLQAASKKGITVFYISNRDTSELASTLENMKALKLPDADLDHMLFLKKASTKEPRRQVVAEKYKVVMLMGDNLNDFTSFFEKKSVEERKAETDKVKDEWGRKFIVLPNSIYGEWENALYGYKHGLTNAQRDSIRVELLKGYQQ